MQPVHEMPVVIKIIAQLLYDNNLPINNYIVLCPHGCMNLIMLSLKQISGRTLCSSTIFIVALH